MITKEVNAIVTPLVIGDTYITLTDISDNRGEIVIDDPKYGEFRYTWGAMGGDIKNFIRTINSDYFTDKLLGIHSRYKFYPKGTFKNIRKYIRNDIGLPWYSELEFQKHLRESINSFQEICEELRSENHFIRYFRYHMYDNLDFNLISNRSERKRIEDEFNSITEPWEFIGTEETDASKWLMRIHKKIVSKLATDLNND